jgi:hypothetical protein
MKTWTHFAYRIDMWDDAGVPRARFSAAGAHYFAPLVPPSSVMNSRRFN